MAEPFADKASAPPSYSLKGYRNKLRTTQAKVLLVEGRDDKRAAVALLREVAGVTVPSNSAVQIDTADIIDEPGGNRERVEAICAGVLGSDVESKLVGLCDREYREFAFAPCGDSLQGHKTTGRLVWTRGHSLENYFMWPEVLEQPLRSATASAEVEKSVALFLQLLPVYIRCACAVGQAADKLGLTAPLKASIDWSVLTIDPSTPLDRVKWRASLGTKQRLDTGRIEQVVEHYSTLWPSMQNVDLSLAAWMCHGHIGITTLWNGYARCVYEAAKDEKEVRRVLSSDEALRCTVLAESWASMSRAGLVGYPNEVLQLLGLVPATRAAAMQGKP